MHVYSATNQSLTFWLLSVFLLSIQSETFTLSAIVLSGSSLKATMTLDGPIAPINVETGLELFTASESFHPHGEESISYSAVIDFEHLAPAPEEEEDIMAQTDDEGPLDPNDPDIVQKRKARRERQREKFLEAKAKRDSRKLEQQEKVRQDGEPAIYSAKAPAEGWYRMCVLATWYQVSPAFPISKSLMMVPSLLILKNCFFANSRWLLKWKCERKASWEGWTRMATL